MGHPDWISMVVIRKLAAELLLLFARKDLAGFCPTSSVDLLDFFFPFRLARVVNRCSDVSSEHVSGTKGSPMRRSRADNYQTSRKR